MEVDRRSMCRFFEESEAMGDCIDDDVVCGGAGGDTMDEGRAAFVHYDSSEDAHKAELSEAGEHVATPAPDLSEYGSFEDVGHRVGPLKYLRRLIETLQDCLESIMDHSARVIDDFHTHQLVVGGHIALRSFSAYEERIFERMLGDMDAKISCWNTQAQYADMYCTWLQCIECCEKVLSELDVRMHDSYVKFHIRAANNCISLRLPFMVMERHQAEVWEACRASAASHPRFPKLLYAVVFDRKWLVINARNEGVQARLEHALFGEEGVF